MNATSNTTWVTMDRLEALAFANRGQIERDARSWVLRLSGLTYRAKAEAVSA